MNMARKWLNDAIFYEIYPQSFKDSNADGIGDFQGIIDKLDYILSLGCNALWLNPCFQSPFMDAGYDISDYYKAAPRYGTNEDLRRLFEAAHKRNMHVLLDLVPGHTSVEHPWFRESCREARNPWTDRYVWTDTEWEAPENMNALHGISERRGAVGVNFFSHQPALNYGFYKVTRPWQQSPEDEGPQATLTAMKDIMRFWLGMGADGFRVDMAGSLIKNDENSKGTIRLWQDVRESILDKEFPEAVMVSEWGEPDKAIEGGFHMDFLLHFGPSHYNDLFRCKEPFFSGRGRGDISAFVEKYRETLSKAAGRGLICIPSGNHDMDRLARALHGDELKIAFAFLLTMPGVPFIYYGDEIGMRYVEGLPSKEGGYLRTGSRTPMQWDRTTNAGFSSAPKEALYLPLDPDHDRPNVAEQRTDENSLLREVQRLTALRRRHAALGNTGDIRFVYAEKDAYPLAYLRTAKDESEKLLVVMNPANREVSFPWEKPLGKAIYTLGSEGNVQEGRMTVPACSAGIYPVL